MPCLLAAAHPDLSWQRKALRQAAPFIDRANEEWTKAIVSGDAVVLSAPYADDGVFIDHDGAAIRGKDAVRAMYSRRPAGVQVLKASIKSDGRAAHDTDDVYEWGTAQLLVRRGGTDRTALGRYLTVWHRKGTSWAITRNIAF